MSLYVVNGVECQPIIDKCEGCERTTEYEGSKYCKSYPVPERKWTGRVCNFATHAKIETASDGKKVNPLKASKRAARGR